MKTLRATIKLIIIVLWLVPSFTVGYSLLHVSRPLLRLWVRFFWSVICKILNVKITCEGKPLAHSIRQENAAHHPVIFVSNHISWLDIPVLGALIYASFVAKKEMQSWPILGWACKLGQTLFVTRHRQSMCQEMDQMRHFLGTTSGNLILFPEGTSSDGVHMHRFKSSFFYLAFQLTPSLSSTEGPTMPLVQPVSLIYNKLNALPVTYERKSVFAWYGSMTLVPHIWQFLQQESAHVTVKFAPPLDPHSFHNRKNLSRVCHKAIQQHMTAPSL